MKRSTHDTNNPSGSRKRSSELSPPARSELFESAVVPSLAEVPEVDSDLVEQDTQAILDRLHVLVRQVRYRVHDWSSRWRRPNNDHQQLYLTLDTESNASASVREEPSERPLMPD